jgi:hypothetical protein
VIEAQNTYAEKLTVMFSAEVIGAEKNLKEKWREISAEN